MDEQLTAQQEREYVEARYRCAPWKSVDSNYYVDLLETGTNTHGACTFPGPTQSAAYHAAYLFTKERERQIAEVEEEVALLEAEATLWPNFYKQQAAYSRILARERAALAELKRGLR